MGSADGQDVDSHSHVPSRLRNGVDMQSGLPVWGAEEKYSREYSEGCGAWATARLRVSLLAAGE